MNAHKNARLTPYSRAVLVRRVVEDGQTSQNAISRFRTEGIAGLRGRSSRPHKLRHPAPEYVIRRIEALRCPRWTGQRTATELGISPSTVGRALSPPRAEQDQVSRPLPPPAPLRAQQIRRDDPHRHQEVGMLQDLRASDHRMAHRHAPKRWSRMEIPARLPTSTGRMPGASWLTTTRSGPMPHLAEGCPSGIYASTLERASVAT